MKDQLPFQARWTVKVLKWLLSREISLEEMLQDEDVLAGVVTYLTKKVQVEEEIPGLKENQEKLQALEKQLDFVQCRLSGADQQRKNEVQDLEKRNSELLDEVVKLTHKVKAAEKEVLESRFTSGTAKAAMKTAEEQLRDLRKVLAAKEEELAGKVAELDDLRARQEEERRLLDGIRNQLKENEGKTRQQQTSWADEKSRLLFMLEERDNALSEAREGQAAATREIEVVAQNLQDKEERLALLEIEAVQKGVPMVKVGDEPVVGERAAKVVAEKKNRPSDDTPVPLFKSTRRRNKKRSETPDPISAVVGFSHNEMMELSDDARYTEVVDLEMESIPEPDVHKENKPAGKEKKGRSRRKKPTKTPVVPDATRNTHPSEANAKTAKSAKAPAKTPEKPSKLETKVTKTEKSPKTPGKVKKSGK